MNRAIAVAMFAGLWAAGVASAQDKYPTRAVQVILPVFAGTATDVVARVVTDKLAQRLGQPFVLQNRPGASGTIATDLVAKAAPDGYTLLMVNSLHSTNPAMHKNLPYDTARDFAGIALFGESPSVLVVNPQLGVRTVKELVDLAKRNPGKINYGTSGVGTNTHFGAAYFIARTGIDMTAVHYKGGEIMSDIISGRIGFLVAPIPTLLPSIRDGKLIALAVTSREPLRAPMELDSVERAGGLPGFEYVTYYGFLAPAKTPARVLDLLSAELRQAMLEKDVRERLGAQAIVPRNLGPAEFDAFLRAETEKAVGLLKTMGIKSE